MARIDFIACPADWRHALDRQTLVCLEPGCGHEAIAIPPATALALMADNNPTKQAHESNDDQQKS